MKETIKFIPDKERKKKIKQMIKEGYRWRCGGCGIVYKDKPKTYERGQDCDIEICRCGSDLFTNLKEILEKWWMIIKVKPIKKTIALKEHNFKYCKCKKGEVWTGDAETECLADTNFKLIEKSPSRKIFKCPKSGLNIILLESTPKEKKNAGYLRIPE